MAIRRQLVNGSRRLKQKVGWMLRIYFPMALALRLQLLQQMLAKRIRLPPMSSSGTVRLKHVHREHGLHRTAY